MDYPAVGVAVLEVEEPVAAPGVLYPCALMGAVDVGGALSQDIAVLVGPGDAAGAEDESWSLR